LTSVVVLPISYRVVCYRQTLQISRQLSDRALEAQACYSLGNTYTLLGDYQQAIEYHVLHLKIARELHDSIGEARACWSLGNAHTALGQSEQAMTYAVRHQDLSIQVVFSVVKHLVIGLMNGLFLQTLKNVVMKTTFLHFTEQRNSTFS